MGLESTYGYTSERSSRFFRWWARTKDALTSDEMLERLQKAERVHRARLGVRGEVDGWRILAYKDGTGVRLVSRNGRDHTRRLA
jgi:hypothetical protein